MNSMTFSQAATVLTDIVKQATGQEAITAITTPAGPTFFWTPAQIRP